LNGHERKSARREPGSKRTSVSWCTAKIPDARAGLLLDVLLALPGPELDAVEKTVEPFSSAATAFAATPPVVARAIITATASLLAFMMLSETMKELRNGAFA
jgi:hypothetical protein